MKTSKDVQLKIIDKMRENVESDKHVYTNIQVKGKGVLSGWLDKGDHYLDFWNCEHRVKPETITINGVEIPKPLSESEMVNIEEKGAVYYPCSNKTLYSLESRNYSVVHKAWENISYATKEEAIEASKALFGIEE